MEITLHIIAQHIQELRTFLDKRIDRLEVRQTNQINSLTQQIDALDERLDIIEIAIVEQNHEGRIRRLEKHTGLATRNEARLAKR